MVLGIALLFLSFSSRAQQTWDAKKNPTVTAITSLYDGKLLPPRPAVTTEDIFPVLGQYQSAEGSEALSIKITLDEQNKGLVWIEGLPQGRIKAMLRKSPATYKIPAQKTEDGKDLAEGVLIYDKDANTLKICIGCNYNSEDPSSSFNVTEEPVVVPEPVKKPGKKDKLKVKVEEKPKPYLFNGTKVTGTTTSALTPQQ